MGAGQKDRGGKDSGVRNAEGLALTIIHEALYQSDLGQSYTHIHTHIIDCVPLTIQ